MQIRCVLKGVRFLGSERCEGIKKSPRRRQRGEGAYGQPNLDHWIEIQPHWLHIRGRLSLDQDSSVGSNEMRWSSVQR